MADTSSSTLSDPPSSPTVSEVLEERGQSYGYAMPPKIQATPKRARKRPSQVSITGGGRAAGPGSRADELVTVAEELSSAAKRLSSAADLLSDASSAHSSPLRQTNTIAPSLQPSPARRPAASSPLKRQSAVRRPAASASSQQNTANDAMRTGRRVSHEAPNRSAPTPRKDSAIQRDPQPLSPAPHPYALWCEQYLTAPRTALPRVKECVVIAEIVGKSLSATYEQVLQHFLVETGERTKEWYKRNRKLLLEGKSVLFRDEEEEEGMRMWAEKLGRVDAQTGWTPETRVRGRAKEEREGERGG